MPSFSKTIGVIVGLAIIIGIGLFATYLAKNGDGSQKVVARVNGEEIRQETIDIQIAQLAENPQVSVPSKDNAEQYAEFQKLILDNIVNETLLFQEAKNAGFTATDEETQTQFDAIVSQFANNEEFEAEMAKVNTNEETLRNDISRYIVIEKYQETLFDDADISVTDEEVKAFYDTQVAPQGIDVPLENIQEQIRLSLEQQKKSDIIMKEIGTLKEKADIEILL